MLMILYLIRKSAERPPRGPNTDLSMYGQAAKNPIWINKYEKLRFLTWVHASYAWEWDDISPPNILKWSLYNLRAWYQNVKYLWEM